MNQVVQKDTLIVCHDLEPRLTTALLQLVFLLLLNSDQLNSNENVVAGPFNLELSATNNDLTFWICSFLGKWWPIRTTRDRTTTTLDTKVAEFIWLHKVPNCSIKLHYFLLS